MFSDAFSSKKGFIPVGGGHEGFCGDKSSFLELDLALFETMFYNTCVRNRTYICNCEVISCQARSDSMPVST